MIRPFLAIVLLAALPPIAHADGPCDAETAAAKRAADPALSRPTEPDALPRWDEGKRHYSEAIKRARVVATQDQAATEFQRAIDAYVAAAMISSAPAILFNLAQTYRAAGDREHAIAQYRMFLARTKPGRPLRLLVECHIATLIAEQESAASASKPAGPPIEPKLSPAVESAAPPSPLATPIVLPLDPMPPHPSPWYDDGLAWGITGTGIAAAGVGVFFLLDARGLRDDASHEQRDDVRIEVRDRADDRQRWGTVATVAGAVLVVGGAVKFAITSGAPAVRATARTSLAISPTTLSLQGRF